MLLQIADLKDKVKQRIPRKEKFQFVVILWFAFIVAAISWQGMPDGGLDMREDILPSLINWVAPWKEGTPLFPWAVVILMPLHLLTPRLATALINVISVILLSLVIRKYQGNILLGIPLLLSPLGYGLFSNGQTDAIVLAGMLLPPGLDLLLFWKPQVMGHAFWVRGRKNLKIYLVSGGILFLLSFFVWGFWPIEVFLFGRDHLLNGWWNKSMWPYSIPVGTILVYLSIKKQDEAYGIIASPLLFPYVNAPSYLGLFAVIASKWPRVFWGCFLVYWVYVIVVLLSPTLNFPIL